MNLPRHHRCAFRSLMGAALFVATSPGGVVARPAPQQVPGGTIVGTVAEQGSLQPIALALVRAVGTDVTALTNAAGQFTLSGVAPGSRALEVTALGYRALVTDPVTPGVAAGARMTIVLEPDPLRIERLVVTADKSARSVQDVAALVSVTDREEVEARGDVELVDALENATGIMHTLQAGTFESIELRGMPRGANEFESTLLLIDGVPQTDSRNSARIVNLPIDDADAIEVVRGPNSALYGRTAIGGAVNVITALPTARPRSSAQVQLGELGLRKGTLTASGPVDDWAGYYFSWASMSNEGFYSRDPEYDVDETSVFGKLTFSPDDRSQAMVSVNSVTSDNSLPTSLPVVGGELLSDLEPGFDRLSNINLPTANFHQEELRLTSSYSRDVGAGVSFTNTFGYRDIQYRFEESGDIIGAPFDLNANTLTMYPFSLQTDEEVYYEEARLALRPAPGPLEDELLLGASYERTTGFRAGDLIYTDAVTFGIPLDFLNPVVPPRSAWEYDPFGGDEYSLASVGLYFQYQLAPVARVELTAAGRYDRLRMENAETFQTGQPDIDATFEAFSPKVSALVRVLEGAEVGGLGAVDLNLYATYSEAFKPPRTPSALNVAGTDPPLDPEDIANWEIGVKSGLANGRARLAATYFRMTRDGIVVSTRQGPFFVPSNAGGQDFKGLEVEAAWMPTTALTLTGNAVFYHNRFGDFVIQTSGGDTDLTGNRLPLVPDRMLNVGASLEPIENVGLTAGLKRVGERFVDQLNTLQLDAYTLVDASLWWSPGPLRLTLSARNLLDHRYFTSGDTSLAESVEVGAPRQLALSVSLTND